MKKGDCKECNTAKGVSIATEFNKFKDVLFNEKIIRHKMKRIQSKKHKLGTYKIDKISLSCFDDKRYVLDDGIYTLPYFHKEVLQVVQRSKKIVIKKKELKKIDRKDYDKKDCEEIEKDCDKKRLKKIVIKKIVKRLHVSNKIISVVM